VTLLFDVEPSEKGYETVDATEVVSSSMMSSLFLGKIWLFLTALVVAGWKMLLAKSMVVVIVVVLRLLLVDFRIVGG